VADPAEHTAQATVDWLLNLPASQAEQLDAPEEASVLVV